MYSNLVAFATSLQIKTTNQINNIMSRKISNVSKALVFGFAISLTVLSSCKKTANHMDCMKSDDVMKQTVAEVNPAVQNEPLTQLLTVAQIRPSDASGISEVMFLENAEIFQVSEGPVLEGLKTAFSKSTKVQVTFDPWQANIKEVSKPSVQELTRTSGGEFVTSVGTSRTINLATTTNESIDDVASMGIINITTSTGLTNVVPDLATAQAMFNYLTTQCCAIGGPYSLDQCISFQYCQDGCYARAHKMCYVINNKYHFDTHKIFSFANSGGSSLSVRGDKWGGCCINWWYHVAPLINVKTPTGIKSYVFDPAMFNQPVLLSTWLHFQENPACSGAANVSMINIQPTSSYSPSSYSGLSFNTDPFYTSTNTTLVNYSGLITCP